MHKRGGAGLCPQLVITKMDDLFVEPEVPLMLTTVLTYLRTLVTSPLTMHPRGAWLEPLLKEGLMRQKTSTISLLFIESERFEIICDAEGNPGSVISIPASQTNNNSPMSSPRNMLIVTW